MRFDTVGMLRLFRFRILSLFFFLVLLPTNRPWYEHPVRSKMVLEIEELSTVRPRAMVQINDLSAVLFSPAKEATTRERVYKFND